MKNNPSFQFVREILYTLKNEYGDSADLYHLTGETQDRRTGKKIINKIKYHIKKLITLPTLLNHQLTLQGAFKQVGGGFTPSGFDIDETTFLIDNHDLPNDFEITVNDYIVLNHRKYDIKSVNTLEHNQGSMIIAKYVRGADVDEVFETVILQKLNLSQVIQLNISRLENNSESILFSQNAGYVLIPKSLKSFQSKTFAANTFKSKTQI